MTDDIVTRLREVACDNRWCGNDPYCRLCDGIDEIERLRKAGDAVASALEFWVMKYDADTNGAKALANWDTIRNE